jgi:iron complex transport system ATP-binding protein
MKKNNYFAIIEIYNASVIKDDCTLLDSISLVINIGEHAAVIGPNGSGKTSLLKLITKDYYPIFNEGKSYIKIFKKTNLSIFELRSKIGILSDNPQNAYNRKCIGRNVILSGFFGSIGIYSYQKITEKMHQKVDEILDFLEIKDLSHKRLDQMSSGEANRFLVGRALVNDPDVLILDEPTSNLDIKSANIFLSYIQKIAKKGKTIIMVTHNLGDIIPEIERVIMMKNGRIFKDGKKEDILISENMSILFDSKIEVINNKQYYNAYLS